MQVPSMDLFIRKESKRSDFIVSLWFVLSGGRERRIGYAPPENWLEYSRRMEVADFLNEATLGQIDACLARGSSVHLRLPLDVNVFKKLSLTLVRNSPRLGHLVRVG